MFNFVLLLANGYVWLSDGLILNGIAVLFNGHAYWYWHREFMKSLKRDRKDDDD